MPTTPAPRRPPSWLTSEWSRSWVAAAPSAAALLGLRMAPDGPAWVAHNVEITVLLVLAVQQFSYIGLTIALLRHRHLFAWAPTTKPVTWWQQYVLLSGSGFGVAVSVSSLALVAVIAASVSGNLRTPFGLAATLCVIVASWASLLLSYTLAYLCRDAQLGWTGLTFPESPDRADGRRQLADFVYFAAAVSTTFGTTDVTVSRTRMRSMVTEHAIIAFVFNTVILALGIGILVSPPG